MLRIVTDGAADMPAGWEKEYDIQVIPINILFGEKTYLQGVDLNNEDFYRLVDESGKIPKTSQPSPFQFKEFYESVAKAGDTILSLHVTSKLSGTYESAMTAARDLGGRFNIVPFDSGAGSAALGMMCREARLMERAGAATQQIIERMYRVRQEVQIVLTVDKLDYARMSGRVGTLQAALASALNVKPIIVLKDGLLDVAERVRTRSKALDRVLELLHARFGEDNVNVAAVHARDPQAAQSLFEKAKKILNIKELILTELSIAVAANLGPGTVGLIVYPAGG
jgi:DegV family protein with EDD domain